MRYLVTNHENQTWRQVQWGDNVSHKETNSNYFFWTYEHPDVAALLVPIECENLQKPKLWSCEVADLSEVDYGTISHDWGYRRRYPWVKTIKEEDCFIPTDEQRVAFAMLCTMNLTENPLVMAWMRNWLLNIDRTPETAKQVANALTDEMCQKYKTYREFYTSSAYPLTHSVVEPEKLKYYTAASAYRAYTDCFYCPNCDEKTLNRLCTNMECPYSAPSAQGLLYEIVNLEKNAEIVKLCTIKEIASIIVDYRPTI
jgi:hypothetical protein